MDQIIRKQYQTEWHDAANKSALEWQGVRYESHSARMPCLRSRKGVIHAIMQVANYRSMVTNIENWRQTKNGILHDYASKLIFRMTEQVDAIVSTCEIDPTIIDSFELGQFLKELLAHAARLGIDTTIGPNLTRQLVLVKLKGSIV